MPFDLEQILKHYAFETGDTRGERFGNGHMHDTYLVPARNSGTPGYVVQRINDHVFRNVPALMHNIERVTRHVNERAERASDEQMPGASLTLEFTKDAHAFHRDSEGGYWRIFRQISPSVTYEVADLPERLYEAGRAIGRFQAAVSDLPSSDLHVTIPRFHNVLWRLEQLDQAVKADLVGRVVANRTEIDFVAERRKDLSGTFLALQHSDSPPRVTHNDTKLNNVLFSPEGRALCLIDLDTVMPGYVQHDFGDAVRSGCSSATEDERLTSEVSLDLDKLRALSRGYFREAEDFVRASETKYFASSPRLLTFIMGVRFLTDHLNGDVYYRIAYEGHNLVRARNQFALVADLERKHQIIADIMRECWNGSG